MKSDCPVVHFLLGNYYKISINVTEKLSFDYVSCTIIDRRDWIR